MRKPDLTQDRLHEALRYDPGSGQFRWRTQKDPNGRAGEIAGARMRSDYWAIHLDGRGYRAHQLAWLYMKGEWGRPRIEHRDGNPMNNRWRNLQLVKDATIAARRARLRSTTAGLDGVAFDRRRNRWAARIARRGRRYDIGRFATAQEAHEAYATAARFLFGEFAQTG